LRHDVAEGGTPLDLGDVRTFLEVADAGGVSPAARRLGVSKSIVSRRLARLEQARLLLRDRDRSGMTIGALGVQLLSRTTHGAVLAEAGATFREYADFDVTASGRWPLRRMAARPRPRRSHRKLFCPPMAKFDGTAWRLFGDVISASGTSLPLWCGMARVTPAACRRGAV
jgi:DNA-binding transcriptional LysR family regulator